MGTDEQFGVVFCGGSGFLLHAAPDMQQLRGLPLTSSAPAMAAGRGGWIQPQLRYQYGEQVAAYGSSVGLLVAVLVAKLTRGVLFDCA